MIDLMFTDYTMQVNFFVFQSIGVSDTTQITKKMFDFTNTHTDYIVNKTSIIAHIYQTLTKSIKMHGAHQTSYACSENRIQDFLLAISPLCTDKPINNSR